MKRAIATAALLLSTAAPAETITVAAGPDAQERLQGALIDAQPGDIVQIGEGRFALTDGLSLDVDSVTVRGAGPDRTILDFKGQQGAGEGLLVTADGVVLRDFAVEDSKGDGIKSKDADRVVYHNLRVEWTGGPKSSNGAYGVYPVSSEHVLVDGVTVRGASDAGIYVGQSRNIVVRNSVAEFNVAGIEIENSYNADVHGNSVSRNTGGILVFDLPNLPQMGGHSVRIFDNDVARNDTPNFAPPGNIVGAVPMGVGVLVMANRNIHVFGNRLGDNATANVMVIAYPRPFNDKSYNPLPRDVVIRDNVHGRAGWDPKLTGGRALPPGTTFPPIISDGAGTGIQVIDTAGALSLGLAEAGASIEQASPSPVSPYTGAAHSEPQPVVLPPSMEAAIR